MPPSQLKRLKASLREQGIVGPQKSKKQKKQIAQNGGNSDKRVNRTSALIGIREQFNPFEVKTSARGPKFEVTSNKTLSGRITKSVAGRPGVKKGLSEENRRKTLGAEMRRRNKVGGIVDKRFGENDPTMAPEDKMLERFAQEKLGSRRHKNTSAFDLEDDEEGVELTHMGKSLAFDQPILEDDFDDEGLELSDEEDHPSDDDRRKRRRGSGSVGSMNGDEDDDDKPERKKSKQEVMRELIAKSKLHKYERQEAKDADEDLREELDKEMSGIHALLRGLGPKAPPPKNENTFMSMNPERAAILTGDDKAKFDKEYEIRLRQLAQDRKAAPTERTKTDDEKVIADARRLQELETKRLRRMKGEAEDSDEEEAQEKKESKKVAKPVLGEFEEEEESDEDFGLGGGLTSKSSMNPSQDDTELDYEDDYVPDELVASGSDLDDSDGSEDDSEPERDDDDDDFIGGLLTEEESKRPEFLTGANAPLQEIDLPDTNGVDGNLPYIFACPETHDELLKMTVGVNPLDLPLMVQRIRAIHDAALKSENKAKLAKFTAALVDHISHLANQGPSIPSKVIETLIRHIHSLARTYALETANAFRRHLEVMREGRPLALTRGDLIILTAIGSIFPTSDHFHQVVTPAMLTIGWNLGQKIPRTLADHASGLYLSTLSLQYQKFSKRYVPEVISFVLNSLCALAPAKMMKRPSYFPYHEPKQNVRLNGNSDTTTRSLSLLDTVDQELDTLQEDSLKASLLQAHLRLIDTASDIWASSSAFFEIFEPISKVYEHLSSKTCLRYLPANLQTLLQASTKKLQHHLARATISRRPLKLHNHKPLAIKTSIPKFEESFDPNKHYDPDRERAEASKLKAEYKKEKKGAMRELRKDANFMAREGLREKKEKDAAYEKKYKRLVAEIQGEEGRESKAYEREKGFRKKGRK